MRHPLTDQYRDGRRRLLDLAATLTEAEGAELSTACPAWSIKDLYAHLAGISTDILSGNTAEAATSAWADGHVEDRRDRTLADVTAEWAVAGAEVSAVMAEFGDPFPLELFVDQWTHEWDVRAAVGDRAAAVPDDTVFHHYLDGFATAIGADAAGLGRIVLDVDGRELPIGDGPTAGRMAITTFEFARASMGRRSARQLAAYPWPIEDPAGHIDALVRWSVARTDIVDPVRS